MNLARRMMRPVYAQGRVVKGFGRGSKELGIPTANFPCEVVESLPPDLSTGIYFGWAKVDDGTVHKMVISVGWNPYYKNEKKSMETHIIHKFDEDFYGSWLRVVVCGYIRPERNYKSLEALIEAINADIDEAKESLEKSEKLKLLQRDKFFQSPSPPPTSEKGSDETNSSTDTDR